VGEHEPTPIESVPCRRSWRKRGRCATPRSTRCSASMCPLAHREVEHFVVQVDEGDRQVLRSFVRRFARASPFGRFAPANWRRCRGCRRPHSAVSRLTPTQSSTASVIVVRLDAFLATLVLPPSLPYSNWYPQARIHHQSTSIEDSPVPSTMAAFEIYPISTPAAGRSL